MTPAIIISRYNSPDPAARRLHVREAMGLCRWAVENGYAPVCSMLHIADAIDPPEDTPETRGRVMEYSKSLARMVGAAGGVAIVPGWYGFTGGMQADFNAWFLASPQPVNEVRVSDFAEIEPYMPRDLVGQVQAAVDEMVGYNEEYYGPPDCVECIQDHTGVTPSEVR